MPDILTLSGWAQPYDSLAIIAPDALHLSYEHCRVMGCITQRIQHKAPAPRTAIGWSLGGTFLMHAISEGKLKPKQLVLLGASLQFVESPDYDAGMDRFTFDLFKKNYATDSTRTARRFNALVAKGDDHREGILRELGFWPKSAEKETWLSWLEMLDRYSYKSLTFEQFPPTLIIHGRNDEVAKIRQAEALHARIPGSELLILDHCGHAPHLHNPIRVKEAIAAHALGGVVSADA